MRCQQNNAIQAFLSDAGAYSKAELRLNISLATNKADIVTKSTKRVPIPQGVQGSVLLANRHACCVCQKPRVQLHHIDGNPTNNDPANIAALCGDHHDMASMVIGLTKKLQPSQVRDYKAKWEQKCRDDIQALSRKRFTFYYCIYKNPPRILEAYLNMDPNERRAAVSRIRMKLLAEQGPKTKDKLFGLNAVPEVNEPTLQALKSIDDGEGYPSYLGKYAPHPADANYSVDFSTQEAMMAFHKYDLWCQIAAQTLAEARGTIPLEDLYKCGTEEALDDFSGSLVTFRLSIRGKNVRIPRLWNETPVGTISGKATYAGKTIRIRMQIRTMYVFSDTAAINLSNGRISGLGVFGGAARNDFNEMEFTIVPMILGTGGWNLYPEKYPK